jgi:hypothetical protein
LLHGIALHIGCESEARKESPEEIQRPEKITIEGSLSVRELAEALKVSETEIIRTRNLKQLR